MHLYYFTDKSIRYLFKKYGFKLLVIDSRYFYWTLPLGYILDFVYKFIFKSSSKLFKDVIKPIRINLFDSKIYIARKTD